MEPPPRVASCWFSFVWEADGRGSLGRVDRGGVGGMGVSAECVGCIVKKMAFWFLFLFFDCVFYFGILLQTEE